MWLHIQTLSQAIVKVVIPTERYMFFFFLNWCTNLENKKKHPIMKLKVWSVDHCMLQGAGQYGWAMVEAFVIISVDRIILTSLFCSFTLHHHSCFLFKISSTNIITVLFSVCCLEPRHHDFSPSQFHSIHRHLIVLFFNSSDMLICHI